MPPEKFLWKPSANSSCLTRFTPLKWVEQRDIGLKSVQNREIPRMRVGNVTLAVEGVSFKRLQVSENLYRHATATHPVFGEKIGLQGALGVGYFFLPSSRCLRGVQALQLATPISVPYPLLPAPYSLRSFFAPGAPRRPQF